MPTIKFQMPYGNPGDVNRTHPVEIEPALVDAVNYPTAYGMAALIDATSHKARHLIASDTAITDIFGVIVRPYPQQEKTSPQPYGAVGFGATPPTDGMADFCRSGLVLAAVNGTPAKGDPVYVWVAASGGGHVQGGFEAQPTSLSTTALDPGRYSFASAADEVGIAELAINI